MFKPMTSSLKIVVALGAALAFAPQALASEGGAIEIERQAWSFGGFKGLYDKAQLQRGFQIYKEVCSACHGLSRVRFRNLVQPGGPEFAEDAVKPLAAEWPNKITDGPNDEGKMFERAPLLSDPILGPYKNDKEARAAQNGALPPDLSLIAKARGVKFEGPFYIHVPNMLRDVLTAYQEAGPDYIYALLTGYSDEIPADMKMADGMSYNKAFPGHQIAMPAPLAKENFVKYQDGTGSLEQNAHDVAAFLAWAADPNLNTRKSLGWIVMLYLVVTTGLLFVGKKRIWSKIPH